MAERPNVLLVILDSARVHNMSLYGYERETTPFLEAFADRSTLYTQAKAPGIHSIASHVSIFTGNHIEEHEAIRHTSQIDTSQSLWAQLGSEHEYATGLFTNNRIVSGASNLRSCFEHEYTPDYSVAKRLENTLDNPVIGGTYYRLEDTVATLTTRTRNRLQGDTRLHSGLHSAYRRIRDTGASISDRVSGSDDGFKARYGGEFTDAFLDWETEQDCPWAACINLMDPHSPYEPTDEFDRWADEENWEVQASKPSVRDTLNGRAWDRLEALVDLYDGGLLQSDAVVEALVESLERRGLLEETLLVITSDHGEAFGEESRVHPDLRLRDHKWGIHEVLTHVPLVVNYPGQTDGRIVDDVVSLTDIPDLVETTIAGDWNGAPPSEDPLVSDGPVLASTFRLPEWKLSKYRSVDDVERYVGPWRAVYEQEGETVRKYARHDDHAVTLDVHGPGEVELVSRDDGGRVARAFEGLDESTVLDEEQTDIDEDLEEQLEDLGYIR
jgi:arylsulfatase A-like enzyme